MNRKEFISCYKSERKEKIPAVPFSGLSYATVQLALLAIQRSQGPSQHNFALL